MPSIYDVANHFDDIAVTDGYSGIDLFYAQFSSFIEASPDGSTSQRRTMSMAPGLTLPSRGTISALGERWIVGLGNVDGIYGKAIRQSFWTKKATGLYGLASPGLAAAGGLGTQAYGHKIYLKDTVNGVSDSEYDPFYNFYFHPSEPISKGSIVKEGSTYHYVRATSLGVSGLVEAGSDELDAGAFQTVTFTSTGLYDPVLDVHSAGSTVTSGILMDRYVLYQQRTEADLKSMSGDMSLLVAVSMVTPVVGKVVEIASRPWKILAVTSEQDAWLLHIRRV